MFWQLLPLSQWKVCRGLPWNSLLPLASGSEVGKLCFPWPLHLGLLGSMLGAGQGWTQAGLAVSLSNCWESRGQLTSYASPLGPC